MKRMAKFAAALLAFLLVYLAVDAVLATKTPDGIGTLKKYYALPADTVDVLFVGSSHIGMNIDPALLMEEEGIASYALWGGMQPVWNSYYYIKEALKTQTPKVIVAEVFLCGVEAEFADGPTALKGMQAMRPSLDKVQLALCSFPTWQEAAEALWGMPTYHTRYAEITAADFADFSPQDTSIQESNPNMTAATPLNMLDYAALTEVQPLAKKQEAYLRRIIALCEGRNIPLILLVAPFQATADEAAHFNAVEEIAREEGVPCLNYLKTYRDIGLDPATDFYDVGHLNTRGVPKFTRALAAEIAKRVELPDRRADSGHIWQAGRQVELPETPLYALDDTFLGDGATCRDTGVKLYENRFATWTLLTRVDTRTFGDDGVYFSAFSEVAAEGHFGIMLKMKPAGGLQLKIGPNHDVAIPYAGDTVDIVVVKEHTRYTVFADGVALFRDLDLPCNSYPGTLLLGCQELRAGGEKFRFSRTRILDLKIYDTALNTATIMAWEPATLPHAETPLGLFVKTPEPVYTLPEPFTGGTLDTGIAPLNASATRFTLLANLTPGAVDGDAVFLSSFSEVPGEYRGLLVRQLDDATLNIIVGSNYGVAVPVMPGKPVHLAIVKDGARWTVYVDGQKALDNLNLPMQPWDGTLLLGAQTDADGNLFRVSPTQVDSLTLYAGVMPEQDILAWPHNK